MRAASFLSIVVIGSECTGKTTLASELAGHYGVGWSPEYAREYLERKKAPLTYDDVDLIAQGQIDVEDALLRDASAIIEKGTSSPSPRLLIHDTNLLSTIIYSRHYYGRCPDWIEYEFDRRRYDLYLLTGIDVSWQPDGIQRDRPDQRERMHALFESELRRRQCHYRTIGGNRTHRLSLAVEHITVQYR